LCRRCLAVTVKYVGIDSIGYPYAHLMVDNYYCSCPSLEDPGSSGAAAPLCASDKRGTMVPCIVTAKVQYLRRHGRHGGAVKVQGYSTVSYPGLGQSAGKSHP
jgi:hypothetical protein